MQTGKNPVYCIIIRSWLVIHENYDYLLCVCDEPRDNAFYCYGEKVFMPNIFKFN